MGRYKHKPVKPKYKKEGEGFWRKTKPRDIIVGKSRAAKGGGTEPLPSEQSKVDRRGRKAAAANEGKKSTIGRGKHGVRYEYLIPEHMKAPKKKAAAEKKVKKGGEGMGYIKEAAKRTKGTKAAPHMVKHSMGSLTGITTAEDWSKMRKMDAELDREWEKAVPSSYQGKGHGRKVVHGNKGAHRKRKGGSVDAQWGGYDFKDGGRIPGIRPTRKGT